MAGGEWIVRERTISTITAAAVAGRARAREMATRLLGANGAFLTEGAFHGTSGKVRVDSGDECGAGRPRLGSHRGRGGAASVHPRPSPRNIRSARESVSVQAGGASRQDRHGARCHCSPFRHRL